MNCRHCGSGLEVLFLDLGMAPPSNAYLVREKLKSAELWFPLRLLVCTQCWLVQTEDYADSKDLFTHDYAYFSSISSSWLDHAKRYANTMIKRFNLSTDSTVVEIAANDGYLLQYFKQHGIPCYGIEPTLSTAVAAREKGIDIIDAFFGVQLAQNLVGQDRMAELIIANNVLAHVPDINDFVSGFTSLLKQSGVASFEFPHLLKMVQQSQFDTAYHEHYSYLSLTAVSRIFQKNGLQVFDVDELSTHGGSLRVFAQRDGSGYHPVSDKVDALLKIEQEAGVMEIDFYGKFQKMAEIVKDDFLSFLIQAKREGKTVAAYGAAAKGNTLLNFAGVKKDLLAFVCDAAASKQGKYLPGSHIPILAPEAMAALSPDYVVILPWNIATEVKAQLEYLRGQGTQFVTAVPRLEVT